MINNPHLAPEGNEFAAVVELVRLQVGKRAPFGDDTVDRAWVDWTQVGKMAADHGVLPLIHRSLVERHKKNPSAQPLSGLTQEVNANALRNLWLLGELVAVLQLFEAAGIPVIPLKGPLLAHLLYDDGTLRQCRDLDILVPKREIQKAHHLLLSQGYCYLGRPQMPISVERFSRYNSLYMRGNVALEMHWEIAPRWFSFSVERLDLWRNLGSQPFGGIHVLQPRSEKLFTLLCVHGTRHCWSRLIWIADVATLASVHRTLDWDEVLADGRALGTEHIVLLGAVLAHELLQAEVPDGIKHRAARCEQVDELKRLVLLQLSQRSGEAPTAEKHAFAIRSRERLRDRMRYCVGLHEIPPGVDEKSIPTAARAVVWAAICICPSEQDRKSVRLPSVISPLYYVLRPLRLLLKLADALCRLVFAASGWLRPSR